MRENPARPWQGHAMFLQSKALFSSSTRPPYSWGTLLVTLWVGTLFYPFRETKQEAVELQWNLWDNLLFCLHTCQGTRSNSIETSSGAFPTARHITSSRRSWDSPDLVTLTKRISPSFLTLVLTNVLTKTKGNLESNREAIGTKRGRFIFISSLAKDHRGLATASTSAQ